MPENEKLTIELELEGRKFQKEMSTQLKAITQWSKQSAKASGDIVKVLEEIKDALKDLSKGYKDVGAAAQDAGKKQARAAKQATEELKKQESSLKKIQGWLSKQGKRDVGGGFLGGLARGTGVAGAYGAMTGPNRGARLGGAIGRGAVGLAARATGFGISGIQNAFQSYLQYGQALYGMTGLGRPGEYRRGLRGTRGLGFSQMESAQMGAGIARATGGVGSVGLAQQLAIAGGFGPGGVGEATSLMGTMRQAGAGFQGAQNQQARRKDFSKMIAMGMESGLEKARLPEFFAGVGGLVRSQFATAAGKVDANVIAKQLAELGSTGKAGFQGARGAQVMGQLDAMIRRPGGGEAGQAMILQAMGFGKPGSKVNYYEAVRRQQEGIRDPENIKRVMEEVYSQYGNANLSGTDPRNQQANLIMTTLSGLSVKQTEELQDVKVSAMSSEEKQKKIKEILEKAEPLEQQALKTAKQGFAGVKGHLNVIEQMQLHSGRKVAPFMMEAQKLQLKMIKALADIFPEMLNVMKDISKAVTNILVDIKRFAGKMSPEKAMEEVAKQSDKRLSEIEKRKPRSIMEVAEKEKAKAEALRRNRQERLTALLTKGGVGQMVANLFPEARILSQAQMVAGAQRAGRGSGLEKSHEKAGSVLTKLASEAGVSRKDIARDPNLIVQARKIAAAYSTGGEESAKVEVERLRSMIRSKQEKTEVESSLRKLKVPATPVISRRLQPEPSTIRVSGAGVGEGRRMGTPKGPSVTRPRRRD